MHFILHHLQQSFDEQRISCNLAKNACCENQFGKQLIVDWQDGKHTDQCIVDLDWNRFVQDCFWVCVLMLMLTVVCLSLQE